MNKALNKKRYGGIDLLKHILAIFVIMQHMRSESRYSEETNLYIGSIVQYISGAVIGFFMISGFFIGFQESLKDSILKIFKRTMIPFFLFSATYTVLLFLLGKASLLQGIHDTLILKGAAMQLYYLSFLFFVYTLYLIIFKVSSNIKANVKWVLTGVLILFAILSVLFPTESPTGSDYELLFIYTICFGIAVFLSILRKENQQKFIVGASIATLICFFIGMQDYRFYHIAVMIVLLTLAYNLSNWFSFFNRQFPGTGGVYLLHTPIVNFGISVILVTLGFLEKQNVFLTLVFTYIITLIGTLIFIRLFPKYKFLLLE